MNKIAKGPRPLRVLWLCFVLIMSAILIIASCLLVRDFMLYDVNINTKVEIDSKTLFPALTVCHHHPFSSEGYKLWRSGKVMSPSDFNRKMRNLTLDQLLMNNVESAELISYNDLISIYYQNLHYKDVLTIGHKSSIFLTCMYLANNQIDLADNCTKREFYRVKLFSHHEHFNCYTFEPVSDSVSANITMLGIIVSLGPEPKHFDMEQSFILDTFRQAQGLKVVVHESGTFPDIDESGLHVEPGKMNEISYRPNQWDLINTPTKPCIKDTSKMVYKDLENTYNYTKQICLMQAEQESIMKHCHCMFIYKPRPIIPDENMPYCGEILKHLNPLNTSSNIDCLSEILDQKEMRQRLEKEKCFQRCQFMTFDSTISITKWRATEWHLYWLKQQITSINQMKQFQTSNPTINVTQSKAFKDWLIYGKKDDLRKTGLKSNELLLKDDNFAYIVLRRESKDSVKKYERLVITQYVLVSRIGGLCSLTVGITLAFIVELVEFFYLYISQEKRKVTTNYSVVTTTREVISTGHGLSSVEEPWKKQSPNVSFNQSNRIELNNHGNTFINRHVTNIDDKHFIKEIFL